MKILKSFALLAGLAFITANVSAQAKVKGNPQSWAENQTTQIKASVKGITADQESKILAVEKNFATTMQSAKASSNGDKDAMRIQLKTARATRDSQIKSILTADQVTQYGKYVTSHQVDAPKN